MHDVFEGIVVYTVSYILQALIEEKVVSLELINKRIESFPYSNSEKANKPRLLYFVQAKGGQKLKSNNPHMKCSV